MNEPEKHYPDAPVRPGDWFLIKYGIDTLTLYAAEVHCRIIRFSSRNWCSDAGVWIHEPELSDGGAIYLGRGKKKWYWAFLPWRNLVCPYFYPKQDA